MTTTDQPPMSPALTDAYRLLRADLIRHLDEAEFLATKIDDWTDADMWTARELIPDLVRVVNHVLITHRENEQGTCRTCHEAVPCPTVQSIHRTVKDPERQFIRLVPAGEPA